MRLAMTGADPQAVTTGDPLCTPARAWHAEWLKRAKDNGFCPILSLSYELFAQYCPAAWQQRASNGDPARTGWVPPSALLSPASAAAMTWLQGVGAAFAGLMQAANVPVRFQIGEPWWWVMADGRPCLYDDAAKAAFGGNPAVIADLRGNLNASQKALLDQAGALLASSTLALRDAVRGAAAPGPAEILLLPFLPTVLDPAMPEARRANLPLGWASPAFDRLQIEDYDWLTAGADAARRAGYATAAARLGYALHETDYLAGFVLRADQREQWRLIDAGLDEAAARQTHERFVWAMPQVCRDGFTRLPLRVTRTPWFPLTTSPIRLPWAATPRLCRNSQPAWPPRPLAMSGATACGRMRDCDSMSALASAPRRNSASCSPSFGPDAGPLAVFGCVTRLTSAPTG